MAGPPRCQMILETTDAEAAHALVRAVLGEIVVDREGRLARWADLIRGSLGAGRTVTAFVNNHYSGHGPASAKRLAELVADNVVPGVTK